MTFVMPDFTSQGPSAYKAALDYYCALGARAALAYAPREQDTPDMTVLLAAGALRSGSTLTEVADQSTGTITAPSVYPRIDRVVIDGSTGAVSVVTGVEAASPAAPAIPAGKLPVARVDLAVGQTSITNADITDERVPGSGPEIAQNLTSPSAYTVPSTQAVADAVAAIPTADEQARALAVMYALLYCRSQSRASGPIPYGYLWSLLTDELETETEATFDATGKYYANGSSQSLRALGTNSGSGFTNPNNAFDNNAATYASGPAYGTGNSITKLFGETVLLESVTVLQAAASMYMPTGDLYYTTNNGSSWTLVASKTFANDQTVQTITFTAISCNGIKLVETSSSSNNACWVHEINPVGQRAAGNMTLIPAAVTVGSHPSSVTLRFLHKSVDAVTYNTDLKARVSTDGGSNWSEYGTIAKLCAYDADYDLLEATFDTSGLTGTSLKAEVSTYNTKRQRVAGIALGYAT